MELLYEKGRVQVYGMPGDKFKTEAMTVALCLPLRRDTAYRNALLPALLGRGCVPYPTQRRIVSELMRLYGAGFGTSVDKKGEIQLLYVQADFASARFAGRCPDIGRRMFRFLLSVLTDPVTEDVNGAPAFREDWFRQEKTNLDYDILAEINDKDSYAARRLIRNMCREEPFGVSETGEPGDGDALTAQELYRYYTDVLLRRTAMRIFYCGSDQPHALIEELEANGHFTGGETRANVLPTGFRDGPDAAALCYVTETLDVTQGKLYLGFRTHTPPDSPDYPALAVMNAVFGGGPQSRLFRTVREEHSLAYYAFSRLERLKGIMTAGCAIDPADRAQAEALVLEQLEEIRRGHITQEELEAAKAALVNALRARQDTQFACMEYYIEQSFLPHITELDSYIRAIGAVTAGDVTRAAGRVALDTVYFLAPEAAESGAPEAEPGTPEAGREA